VERVHIHQGAQAIVASPTEAHQIDAWFVLGTDVSGA